MRILHCLRAPVGGLFRHVLDLASAQSALGHEVGLILASGPGDALTDRKLGALSSALHLGITRVAMPRLPGPSDLMAYCAIAAHVRAVRADVLHGHGAKGGAYARLAGRAAKRAGLKLGVFYTPHGGTLHYPAASLQGRFYCTLERRFDVLTDGIIFESDFARRTYADRIGPGRAPKRVIYNGLAPEDFAEYATDPDAADVLFIGELRHLKGVDVLLQALADLKTVHRRPVTAVIVGAGGEAKKLRGQATGLGLDATVRFPGALPAREAFALGRVLAVPSRAESLPYIVLEAAAAGRPFVATDVGGIGEIVSGTDTPLITAGDATALANSLAIVIDHPEMAQARARRLKAAVLERFTTACMTSRVLAFYSEALESLG